MKNIKNFEEFNEGWKDKALLGLGALSLGSGLFAPKANAEEPMKSGWPGDKIEQSDAKSDSIKRAEYQKYIANYLQEEDRIKKEFYAEKESNQEKDAIEAINYMNKLIKQSNSNFGPGELESIRNALLLSCVNQDFNDATDYIVDSINKYKIENKSGNAFDLPGYILKTPKMITSHGKINMKEEYSNVIAKIKSLIKNSKIDKKFWKVVNLPAEEAIEMIRNS